MSKRVEHDLLSLLPSITFPVPPELINLGVSLIAQSRNKAATLKKDEEIARGYACAHIACERLKTSLDLPTIIPRPPVPARVYKKLYAYLNSALALQSARQVEQTNAAPAIPSTLRIASAKATPNKPTPSKPTPSKSRTPRAPTSKRTLDARNGDEVPDWVMPAIRTLCKEFDKPSATTHVFVGVSSILKLLRERTNNAATQARKRPKQSSADYTDSQAPSFEEKQIPALIAVVTLYTISLIADRAPTANEYKEQRELAVETLLATVPEGATTSEEDMVKDIEIFLREGRKGWIKMEWYQNLAQQVDTRESGDDVDFQDEGVELAEAGDEDKAGEPVEEDGEAPIRKRAPRKGAGTTNGIEEMIISQRAFGGMMTPDTDYLSPEKREDYRKWKARALAVMNNGRQN